MGCLNWKSKGTPVGEDNIFECSSMTLSTCFYCVERSFVEALNVAMIFCSFLEKIMKKTNFSISEMTFLQCLAEIKEITLGGTALGIL
jgi:hypothetical protein